MPPEHDIRGIEETDPADIEATYQRLAREIAPLGLGSVGTLRTAPDSELVQGVRRTVGVPLVMSRGFKAVTGREKAAGLVADGMAKAVRVGRPTLANPDLVER